MEMTLEQLTILTPALRLISGFEMAAYREALLQSLEDGSVSSEESQIIAHEYNKTLEFYSMSFKPVIQ
jgi:hypothetical protein